MALSRAPENHPFEAKLRAARRLDPDQKKYLRDVIAVKGISVWDYAMIGSAKCGLSYFAGK